MAKRVFVLGIDALNPKLLMKLVEDGELPNFRKLMANGGFSKALAAIPAQTPENWTTIATGAWPGTHGIATWGRRFNNVPITEYFGNESMSSNLCRAEYIWEALAKRGLRSVLLYFVGYPPTTDKTVFVDWFWTPGKWYFEICSAACYISEGSLRDLAESRVTIKRMIERGLLVPVSFKEKTGDWINLPESRSPALCARIVVRLVRPGKEVVYDALLLEGDDAGYDTLAVCKDKDYSKLVCKLMVGEWSWFFEEFEIKARKQVGTVRFKLVEVSPDGSKFKLYRSQVYPISDFVYPLKIGRDLINNFGPYINEGIEKFLTTSILDRETITEELVYQIKWISNVAAYLMAKNASLYMMHWHLIDAMQHMYLGHIEPTDGIYDPKRAEEGWSVLKLCYRLADMLAGEFMKLLDNETYLIVVSDHGHVPNKKRYPLLKALEKAGLIVVERAKDGEPHVDWSRSKIHISMSNIYVNLKSRYKNGTVEDSEYEEIREQVLSLLRSLKDERGKYAISLVLKKEDAPMVGLWGDSIGDIIYVYSSDYTWSHEKYEENFMPDGGASHGPKIPTAETEYGSNYAVFMMAGPNIKKGYIRPLELLGPVLTVDVAPTIAYLLGVDPPRHSQGRILYDFLEGWDVSEVKREHKPLDFPERMKLFIGDVTEHVMP